MRIRSICICDDVQMARRMVICATNYRVRAREEFCTACFESREVNESRSRRYLTDLPVENN